MLVWARTPASPGLALLEAGMVTVNPPPGLALCAGAEIAELANSTAAMTSVETLVCIDLVTSGLKVPKTPIYSQVQSSIHAIPFGRYYKLIAFRSRPEKQYWNGNPKCSVQQIAGHSTEITS